jgi:sugar phosphate permease
LANQVSTNETSAIDYRGIGHKPCLTGTVKSNMSSALPNSPPSIADAKIRADLQKRWLYVMPVVFITYSLAYLDRANFGFGAAAGMATTVNITGKQISLLTGVFFLGYFAFQLPGTAFAKRVGVTRMVFALLVAWGAFAALTGVIRFFPLLVLDRFLLGVSESLIFPAMLVLVTNWFTRAERSRANAVLILGNPLTVLWMSIITGYLIQDFGWQKTFIIEGLPSILWAAIWIALMRDRPSEARWMTPDAADSLERELAAEQTSVAPIGELRKALLRADVLLLCAQFFCWSLGVYGFVLWLPTIVHEGAALSMGNTGLLSAVPYLAAVLLMLLVSHISDKTRRREILVWPFLLLSGVAFMGSFLIAKRSFPLAFACLVIAAAGMYAPYGPYWAIIPERLPRNVTGEVMALINSFGALGGFFGTYFVGFLQTVTGSSKAGFLFMSVFLICSALLVLCLPAVPPRKVINEI